MGYFLQAIIAPSEAFASIQVEGSRAVQLAKDLSILPITSQLREHLGIEEYPLDSRSALAMPLMDICLNVSRRSKAIYVEAMMHGGPPVFQAFLGFENGKTHGAAVKARDFGPLSEGLRFLGVSKGSARDEFEAVGLGRYRETDMWTQGDKPAMTADTEDQIETLLGGQPFDLAVMPAFTVTRPQVDEYIQERGYTPSTWYSAYPDQADGTYFIRQDGCYHLYGQERGTPYCHVEFPSESEAMTFIVNDRIGARRFPHLMSPTKYFWRDHDGWSPRRYRYPTAPISRRDFLLRCALVGALGVLLFLREAGHSGTPLSTVLILEAVGVGGSALCGLIIWRMIGPARSRGTPISSAGPMPPAQHPGEEKK